MLLSTNANLPREGQGSQTTSHTHPRRLHESKLLLAALQNTAPAAIPQPAQLALPMILLAIMTSFSAGHKMEEGKKN